MFAKGVTLTDLIVKGPPTLRFNSVWSAPFAQSEINASMGLCTVTTPTIETTWSCGGTSDISIACIGI
jgi:hypothetical protein